MQEGTFSTVTPADVFFKMSSVEDLSKRFTDFMISFREYQIENKQVLDAVQNRLKLAEATDPSTRIKPQFYATGTPALIFKNTGEPEERLGGTGGTMTTSPPPQVMTGPGEQLLGVLEV